jgi:hypothetical protein
MPTSPIIILEHDATIYRLVRREVSLCTADAAVYSADRYALLTHRESSHNVAVRMGRALASPYVLFAAKLDGVKTLLTKGAATHNVAVYMFVALAVFGALLVAPLVVLPQTVKARLAHCPSGHHITVGMMDTLAIFGKPLIASLIAFSVLRESKIVKA